MSSLVTTKFIGEMTDLPDDLQQQVLKCVVVLRQQHIQASGIAWNVLKFLTGTVEAPTDWSDEQDHYLDGTPKHQKTEP